MHKDSKPPPWLPIYPLAGGHSLPAGPALTEHGSGLPSTQLPPYLCEGRQSWGGDLYPSPTLSPGELLKWECGCCWGTGQAECERPGLWRACQQEELQKQQSQAPKEGLQRVIYDRTHTCSSALWGAFRDPSPWQGPQNFHTPGSKLSTRPAAFQGPAGVRTGDGAVRCSTPRNELLPVTVIGILPDVLFEPLVPWAGGTQRSGHLHHTPQEWSPGYDPGTGKTRGGHRLRVTLGVRHGCVTHRLYIRNRSTKSKGPEITAEQNNFLTSGILHLQYMISFQPHVNS